MAIDKFKSLGRGFGSITSLGRAGTSPPPTPANTLQLGTGVFVLSGDPMTVLVDYNTTLGTGAFVLAGQDMTLIGPPSGKILLADGSSSLLLVDAASKVLKAA